MIKEVLELLAPADGLPAGRQARTIVDCTLGGGGHAFELKSQNAKLKIVGFDQDTEALTAAQERLKKFDNITYVHDNFSQLKKHLKGPVDGFLFDLGVRSTPRPAGSACARTGRSTCEWTRAMG
jgi:16S rRNA C1402 N4-methylase RsmH